MFQFTHPGRGATGASGLSISRPRCFNSRTPGGVRLPCLVRELNPGEFQFTHPGRGATGLVLASIIGARFQFTHPGRGATLGTIKSENDEPCFNSRTPGGVRRRSWLRSWQRRCFNSRTPGGVRRSFASLIKAVVYGFNSRTPGGVRLVKSSKPKREQSFNSRTPGGVRRTHLG